MLSQNPNPTTMDMIPGKIRKRGCSSSASSSSSVLHNYRFKRTILVGKRGGSSTPVPTWKLMSSRSPLRALASPKYPPSQTGNKPRQAPVSARKLAATLWEMNEIPSPSPSVRSKKELRTRERVPRSMRSGSLPPHLSDPSHSPVSEVLSPNFMCFFVFVLLTNLGLFGRDGLNFCGERYSYLASDRVLNNMIVLDLSSKEDTCGK